MSESILTLLYGAIIHRVPYPPQIELIVQGDASN